MTLPRKRFHYHRDTNEFARSLGFVDAIFGFSATLLVTSLDVPPAEDWRSLSALLGGGLGRQLLVFALSFAVIAGFWRFNHRVISTFRALDATTLRILLWMVALVIFIPFTTRANSDPDPAQYPLPMALYAGNIALVMLLGIALIVTGRRRGLTDDDRPLSLQIAGAGVWAAVFLVSIPMAYRFGPKTAQWCWLSLFILHPLVDRIVERRSRPAPPASAPK